LNRLVGCWFFGISESSKDFVLNGNRCRLRRRFIAGIKFKKTMEYLSLLDIIIRLGGAALLGGLIGYEREFHHKPAGIRTDMLVGIGTAAMAIASIEIAKLDPNGAVDISRIVSTILTGIGFIGAGTIIQAKGHVVGLTTAASIWVVAAIGIAMGLGMFNLAVIAATLTLLVLLVLHRFRIQDHEKNERVE